MLKRTLKKTNTDGWDIGPPQTLSFEYVWLPVVMSPLNISVQSRD